MNEIKYVDCTLHNIIWVDHLSLQSYSWRQQSKEQGVWSSSSSSSSRVEVVIKRIVIIYLKRIVRM